MIGVDFDNTIVCYDDLFHHVAVELGLIPQSVSANKSAVRQYLEDQGKGDTWTELQGHVYGTRMGDAKAFPGVLEFFRASVSTGVPLCIVSHKTRYPALGPKHDLHRAADKWLEDQGFYDPSRIGLPRNRVYFELTQREKVARIAQTGCTVFIDDLAEVLAHPDLPAHVQRILFDPHKQHAGDNLLKATSSWIEIERLIRCNHPAY